MTDLLLTILLVGAAATYVLELIDAISLGMLEKSTINIIFSVPLSTAGMWIMQKQWSLEMLITVPAATFVSLLLVKFLNKPQQVEVRRVPRI